MTFEEAVELVGKADPTEDETRNGWSVETLTIYLGERALAQRDTVLDPAPIKPTKTNNGLRWLR